MKSNFLLILLGLLVVFLFWDSLLVKEDGRLAVVTTNFDCWTGKGINQIPVEKEGELILYGRKLVENTAYYLGPNGTIQQISNGMNCQNCHLEAGTKPWGNNYGAVASTYPKYRDRSGKVESIVKRVNDCLERSLNGHALDSNSQEMRAFVSYIQWLGKDVPIGSKPKGSGIMDLQKLHRSADVAKGKMIFLVTCARCHGKEGEGQKVVTSQLYLYPPLWGKNSYNTGAGLYRISRLAGFVKNNMPNPVNYHQPQLSNEEAWDVAAFINSQPRPGFDNSKDWPNISKKPFDHPFGPYADGLSETQHKYGPWQ